MTELAELYERLLESERQRAAAEQRAALAEAELARLKAAAEALERLEREQAERRKKGRGRTARWRHGDDAVTSHERHTSVTPPSVSLDPQTPINPSTPPRSQSVDQSAAAAPEDLPDPDPDVELEIRTGFTSEQLEALGRLVVRLSPSHRAPFRDFLRSLPTPQRRVAWTYQLGMILDGERVLKPTPEQLGRALLEMTANGAGDNSKLFTGYLRREIAADVEHAAGNGASGGNGSAPTTEHSAQQRAQETRRAPQNWRAARGKALIEAANIVEWVRDRRSAQYPRSLTTDARAELAKNARWTAALKAAGGTESRILDGHELDKLRDQLADALQALDEHPPEHPPHPPPSAP